MLSRRTRVLPMMAALLFAAACSSDQSTSGVSAGAPARMTVATSPSQATTVGGSAGAFAINVSDANGIAVSGVLVTFSNSGALTLSPSSATTDASGIATTQVTAGTVAGSA